MWDVIIVGGGPSGLTAALILGRCRRRVLVCDEGKPRNRASRGLHGFLTREGTRPAELLRLGREQLREYPNVELRPKRVCDAGRRPNGFAVTLAGGERPAARKLVLATGLADQLPALPGLEDFYGKSAFHCPYCDAWEYRDQPVAAYGRGAEGLGLALELTGWCRDLTLCTDGPAQLDEASRRRLRCHRVRLREGRVRGLEGRDGALESVVFADGTALACRALFFPTAWRQCSDLPAKLGCTFSPAGAARVDLRGSAGVPGLYVVGDAATEGGMVVLAAAEGARAAVALNTELLKEDLARREGAEGRPAG